MKTEEVFTKKPFAYRSFRLPRRDLDAWKAAAAKLDVSQSELLRQALRDKANRVLGRMVSDVGKPNLNKEKAQAATWAQRERNDDDSEKLSEPAKCVKSKT